MGRWPGNVRSSPSDAVENTVNALADAYAEVVPRMSCAIHARQFLDLRLYKRLEAEFNCTVIFETENSAWRLGRNAFMGRPALLLPQLPATVPRILEAVSAQAMAGLYFFDSTLLESVRNVALKDQSKL